MKYFIYIFSLFTLLFISCNETLEDISDPNAIDPIIGTWIVSDFSYFGSGTADAQPCLMSNAAGDLDYYTFYSDGTYDFQMWECDPNGALYEVYDIVIGTWQKNRYLYYTFSENEWTETYNVTSDYTFTDEGDDYSQVFQKQ